MGLITTTLNEGQDYAFTLNTPISTTGSTFSVVWREFNSVGSGAVIATANGASAYTDIAISISTSSYESGDYLLELWEELGETNQRLVFPPEGDVYKITIQDRMRG
jgi:hypothetical protein